MYTIVCTVYTSGAIAKGLLVQVNSRSESDIFIWCSSNTLAIHVTWSGECPFQFLSPAFLRPPIFQACTAYSRDRNRMPSRSNQTIAGFVRLRLTFFSFQFRFIDKIIVHTSYWLYRLLVLSLTSLPTCSQSWVVANGGAGSRLRRWKHANFDCVPLATAPWWRQTPLLLLVVSARVETAGATLDLLTVHDTQPVEVKTVKTPE